MMACFVDYLLTFWGPGVISTINEPRGASTCRSSTLAVLADAGPFHGLFTHCFGALERFPRLTNPGVRLRVGHQHSQVWPMMARFVDYLLTFWGPGGICTINEPRGASTCRSSTLAVLADDGLFRGLFTHFLGPRSDFHD